MVPGTRDESARAPRRGGRRALPGWAVTFMFTDIEGSTRLVKALRDRYAEALARHRRLVRAAIAAHGRARGGHRGGRVLRRRQSRSPTGGTCGSRS
jgi:class 3 adenylate cyclase